VGFRKIGEIVRNVINYGHGEVQKDVYPDKDNFIERDNKSFKVRITSFDENGDYYAKNHKVLGVGLSKYEEVPIRVNDFIR